MTGIKNSRLLIDTDIIIDHFRSRGNLNEIMEESANNDCCISVISIAEIYSLLYLHEYVAVESLISFLEVINVDSIIAKLAGNYRMSFLKSHSLTIPDAIIAATANVYDTMLITGNIKHYPMDDIEKIKPY